MARAVRNGSGYTQQLQILIDECATKYVLSNVTEPS